MPFDRYSNVRIEVELAFVLAGRRSRARAARSTTCSPRPPTVRPALEMLDSHVELEGRTIVDTIATTPRMGAMVLGGTRSRRTRSTCAGSGRC